MLGGGREQEAEAGGGFSGRVGVDRCSAQSGTFGSDFPVELRGTRPIDGKAFPHGDTDKCSAVTMQTAALA